MQAALFVRNKKKRQQKAQPPTQGLSVHVSIKEIGPFPRYNPILDDVTCNSDQSSPMERKRFKDYPKGFRRIIMAVAALALRNKQKRQRIKSLREAELPNGKGAWKGDTQSTRPSKKRLGKNNKVGDVNLTPAAAQQEKYNTTPAHKYKNNGVVNILLYVGFALAGLGLILTFVGTGERGFKTKELRLIGPSLIGAGILFVILRILFCSFSCSKRDTGSLDKRLLLSQSQETIDNEGQSTPPPLIEVQKSLSRVDERAAPIEESATSQTLLEENPSPSSSQDVVNLVANSEVDSDVEFELELQKVEIEKMHVDNLSIISQTKELLTPRGNIPVLDSSFQQDELLLDPSKLEPTSR